MAERSNYERETEAVQVPNLTGKVEVSNGEHFALLKAGEIAATHTKYTGGSGDGELPGYATVQGSSYFGSTLMLAALKRIGEVKGEVDQQKLVEAMYAVMQEAGIESPLLAEGTGHTPQEEGGEHAA